MELVCVDEASPLGYRFARLVSYILSPPFVALAVVAVFAFLSPVGTGLLAPWQSFLIGVIFVAIGPVLPLTFMVALGRVSFDVEDRRDRPLLYLAAVIIYVVGAVLAWFYLNRCMAVIAAAYAGVTSAIALVSLFKKASAHSAGVAGPVTALIWVYGVIAMPLLLLVVVVGWSRWRLGLHTPGELVGGAVIAVIVTATIYLILWGP